jgi:predicted adenine nucleotide alpha hydrolase (AANH) superfamily ATPase
MLVKPKLLFQVCCATCAGYLVSQLKERFEITLFFCNPNLDTLEEYFKRLKDVEALAELYKLKLDIIKSTI